MNNMSEKKGFSGLSDLIDEFDTKKASDSSNIPVQPEEHIEAEEPKENLSGKAEETEKETPRDQRVFSGNSSKGQNVSQNGGAMWTWLLGIIGLLVVLIIVGIYNNGHKQ